MNPHTNPFPPGEMRFKEWVAREAAWQGVSWHGIYERIQAGKYPLNLRRVSSYTIFVVPSQETFRNTTAFAKGGV